MISIYWLGLEGDDVRFDEPHATTDKPLLSFEPADDWGAARGWYVKNSISWASYLRDNEYLIFSHNKNQFYKASTALAWILYWQSNGDEKPPFVKEAYLIDQNGKEMGLPIKLKVINNGC